LSNLENFFRSLFRSSWLIRVYSLHTYAKGELQNEPSMGSEQLQGKAYRRCLRSTSPKPSGLSCSFMASMAKLTSSKPCSVVGMFSARAICALGDPWCGAWCPHLKSESANPVRLECASYVDRVRACAYRTLLAKSCGLAFSYLEGL
jgi:hypothetical protein